MNNRVQRTSVGHSPVADSVLRITDDGFSSTLRRFPITLLSGVHHILLVLVPALLYSNPHGSLLFGIVAVALTCSFFTELILDRFRRKSATTITNGYLAPIPSFPVWVVLAVGVAADTLSSIGGARSYSVQLGEAQRSGWVAFLTPFSAWSIAGIVMVLWLWRTGRVSPKPAATVIGIVCALKLSVGLSNGIVGASIAYVLTVLIVAIWLGLLSVAQFGGMLAIGLFAWPVWFGIRNQIRSEVVGEYISDANPFERMRLDEQMATARLVIPRPAILEPPTWLTILRTGLLPSTIDPDRPPIDVGTRFSVALGGTETNATSATLLGNVLVFLGWPGLIIFSIAMSGMMVLVLRGRTVWSFSSAALIYMHGLSFASTYPVSVVRILQSLVSLIFLFALFSVLSYMFRPIVGAPNVRNWQGRYRRSRDLRY